MTIDDGKTTTFSWTCLLWKIGEFGRKTNDAKAKSLKERLGAIADAWDTWWNRGTGLCDLVSLSSFNI